MWALLLGPGRAAAAAAAQGGADAGAASWPAVVTYAITGMMTITAMFLVFMSLTVIVYTLPARPAGLPCCPCPTCVCVARPPKVSSIRGGARFRQSHPGLKARNGCRHGPDTCCVHCAVCAGCTQCADRARADIMFAEQRARTRDEQHQEQQEEQQRTARAVAAADMHAEGGQHARVPRVVATPVDASVVPEGAHLPVARREEAAVNEHDADGADADGAVAAIRGAPRAVVLTLETTKKSGEMLMAAAALRFAVGQYMTEHPTLQNESDERVSGQVNKVRAHRACVREFVRGFSSRVMSRGRLPAVSFSLSACLPPRDSHTVPPRLCRGVPRRCVCCRSRCAPLRCTVSRARWNK